MNKDTKRYTAERCALRHAIARCHDDTHIYYHNYGGRGIGVCTAWRDPATGFKAFIDHIGPRPNADHSLDRINNDRGYEPGNVRWCGDWREQMLNRRKDLVRRVRDFGLGVGNSRVLVSRSRAGQPSPLIEHQGRVQTLCDWARELGMNAATIRQRMMKGWTADRALDPVLLNPRGRPRKDQPTTDQEN